MKINHAIIHVFDFIACENAFANEEIDLTNKTAKNYVSKHAVKALGSIDNKRGEFSANSHFAAELRAYYQDQRDFVGLSQAIGQYLVEELGHMERTPSTDLLVVDYEDEPQKPTAEMTDEEVEALFQGRANRYFGIFLLESKQAYMHNVGVGETGECNDISRHYAILPNPSQKLQSYAIVDLHTQAVLFADKKRVIAGEECWLIPDKLLQCSMEASSKEAFTAVTELVRDVAEEHGANTAVAVSKAKAYVTRVAEEEGLETTGVNMRQLVDDVFDNNPELAKRAYDVAQARELPERMPLERDAVRRVARSHKIVTDTGITITFPAEYSRNSDYLTFTSNADGKFSIELKNIGSFENK